MGDRRMVGATSFRTAYDAAMSVTGENTLTELISGQ
jgi:hypothetical protein